MSTALLRASRWRRWMALMPEERMLLLRSVASLVKLRFTPTHTRLEPAPEVASDAPALDPVTIQTQRLRAHHVARLVAYAAAVSPVTVAGLHRSIVLWDLLGREGIPCRLRVGQHNDAAPALGTHPWVECHGEPLHEAADPYQPFSPGSLAVRPARKG